MQNFWAFLDKSIRRWSSSHHMINKVTTAKNSCEYIGKCWTTSKIHRKTFYSACERLLLNHADTPGFLASGGEEFNPGPEMRLDHSELLCDKVLLKYKGDRESFWHRHQKGVERIPPC